MIALDPRTTALVLIDLQNGIVGRPLAPHAGPDVVAKAKALAERFRAARAPVVLVRVTFAADFADAPSQNVDQPQQVPPGGYPQGWDQLVEGLPAPSDILVVKRQWGAFHGTDLDTQLRRRSIKTIVLGGVATSIGVEGTAREAWAHGYDVVVVEDAMSDSTAEAHAMSRRHILPRLSRVVTSAEVRLAGA